MAEEVSFSVSISFLGQNVSLHCSFPRSSFLHDKNGHQVFSPSLLFVSLKEESNKRSPEKKSCQRSPTGRRTSFFFDSLSSSFFHLFLDACISWSLFKLLFSFQEEVVLNEETTERNFTITVLRDDDDAGTEE